MASTRHWRRSSIRPCRKDSSGQSTAPPSSSTAIRKGCSTPSRRFSCPMCPSGYAGTKRSASTLAGELVAEAVDGEDVLGDPRVGLEFLPQPRHVHVDRPGRRRRVVAPDLVQQL